jgi:hypothetical protein
MLENIFSGVLMRPLGSRLDSRDPTWLKPRMASWVAAVLVCFTWQLSFPMQGVMGRSYAATCIGI